MAQPAIDADIQNDAYEPEVLLRRPARARLFALAHQTNLVIGLVTLAVIALVCLAAPLITHFDPTAQDPNSMLQPPSSAHPFGTDQFGRDILSRVLFGGRNTMSSAVEVMLLGVVVGSSLGIAAGFFGGMVEMLIMRAMDLLLAFPGILLALAVTTILGPGLFNAVIAIAVVSIPSYARVLQAATLRVRDLPFVDAARALGVPSLQIVRRHIFPNVMSQVIVLGTVWLGIAALWVAALGFLGLGLQPPSPEWGSILNDGKDYVELAWWVSLFPGIFISLFVIASNLIGDGLRDVLDPTLNFTR